MVDIVISVNVEQLVYQYLDAHSMITAPVWTEIPANATYPLIRVRRVSGAPTSGVTRWHDRAFMQLDVYGGSKSTAHDIAQRCAGVLDDPAFIGVHAPLGVVTGVEFGDMRDVPDTAFTPAKPRWACDVAIYTHPLALIGS